MILNEKIAQFIDVLKDINVPGLIMSTPGTGKTSTLELYAGYRDLKLTSIIASQYAADDILGIQSVQDGKLVRLTPAWYNEMVSDNSKRHLLFIDEITTCDEFIQAPLLNLIFNKSLGLHKLPDDTIIVAAGNYADNLGNRFEMSTPLVNRFMILNLDPNDIDKDEIFEGDIFESLMGIENKKDSRIISDYFKLNSSKKLDNDFITDVKSIIKSTVDFGKIRIENSTENGLIGFPSTRSVSYALNYLTQANKSGNMNQMALKVISDTISNYDESNKKPLYALLNQKLREYNIKQSINYLSCDWDNMSKQQRNDWVRANLNNLDRLDQSLLHKVFASDSELDTSLQIEISNKALDIIRNKTK